MPETAPAASDVDEPDDVPSSEGANENIDPNVGAGQRQSQSPGPPTASAVLPLPKKPTPAATNDSQKDPKRSKEAEITRRKELDDEEEVPEQEVPQQGGTSHLMGRGKNNTVPKAFNPSFPHGHGQQSGFAGGSAPGSDGVGASGEVNSISDGVEDEGCARLGFNYIN